MSEKQASSEIAQSRELAPSPVSFWDGQKYRFCPKCQQLAFEFAKAYGLEIRQAAEGDTRERCAQIAEGIAGTEPDGVFEAGYDCGARMAANCIRGKE